MRKRVDSYIISNSWQESDDYNMNNMNIMNNMNNMSNSVGVGYEPCYSDDNRSVARMKF
jgi:hypothetical protein